jgi:hypothetical protein
VQCWLVMWHALPVVPAVCNNLQHCRDAPVYSLGHEARSHTPCLLCAAAGMQSERMLETREQQQLMQHITRYSRCRQGVLQRFAALACTPMSWGCFTVARNLW